MAIFKCKMCGGTLNVNEGITVCECEYCGHEQKVPRSIEKNILIDEDYDYDDEYDEDDEENEKEIARKLKLGYTCLKIEDWKKAHDYFWNVRCYDDSECAEAYLGMFLADNELKSLNELENTEFDNLLKEDNYKEAYLFGNKALKEKLKHYAEINADRFKEKAKDKLKRDAESTRLATIEHNYNVAILLMTEETEEFDYQKDIIKSFEEIEVERKNNYVRAKKYFDSLQDYKDSVAKSKECDELIAEWNRKSKIYNSAKSTWEKGTYRSLKKSYDTFKSIKDYSEAKWYINSYESMKYSIKTMIIYTIIFTIIFLILYFLNFIIFHGRNENVWNIMLVTVSILQHGRSSILSYVKILHLSF